MLRESKKAVVKKIQFRVDGDTLAGDLHLPEMPDLGSDPISDQGGLPPVVIGSHGLFSDRQSPKQIALAGRLNRVGIAFFRFDHRGCGDSEGNFAAITSLGSRCEDIKAAAAAVRAERVTDGRIALFGSSMGGAACLAAAETLEYEAIVTLAAPVRITSESEAAHAIRMADHDQMLDASFFKRSLPFDLSGLLPRVHDILIFHGDEDAVIPVSNAREIYEKACAPKKLVIHPQGDHRMSNPVHQDEFMQLTTAWFKAGFNL